LRKKEEALSAAEKERKSNYYEPQKKSFSSIGCKHAGKIPTYD